MIGAEVLCMQRIARTPCVVARCALGVAAEFHSAWCSAPARCHWHGAQSELLSRFTLQVHPRPLASSTRALWTCLVDFYKRRTSPRAQRAPPPLRPNHACLQSGCSSCPRCICSHRHDIPRTEGAMRRDGAIAAVSKWRCDVVWVGVWLFHRALARTHMKRACGGRRCGPCSSISTPSISLR